ncbi:hypothetical protein [Pseudobdellovibrio exovorus]|uniref:Uncharacterized protein n=1 Tax=Pseudobdellovibrio exovorus JSS TaxID=1184267 RepID=M4VTT0_9BACT|nr:hypothetical protein [Pseudobdellovibrio exovorus]AGH96609.1 hypothetical protein A11Q_2393 [Pseudobdellovibrio exovorus JSS]
MKFRSVILAATLMLSQAALANSNNCVADSVKSSTGVTVLGTYSSSDSRSVLRNLQTNPNTAARQFTNVAGQLLAVDYTLKLTNSVSEDPRWPNDGCRAIATKSTYCSDGKNVACAEICIVQKSCIDPR